MTSFMEGRRLKLTLVSAQNLPDDMRSLGRMRVYAEVSLNGNPATARKSDVDNEGKTEPTWNFVAGYTVKEVVVQLTGVNLVVKLSCKRTRGDKLIGEVKIPIKNLFDMHVAKESDSPKILSYDVEGTDKGVLNISYSFGQKMAVPTPALARARQSSSTGQKIIAGIELGLSVLGLVPGGLFGGDEEVVYEEVDDGGMGDADYGEEECRVPRPAGGFTYSFPTRCSRSHLSLK